MRHMARSWAVRLLILGIAISMGYYYTGKKLPMNKVPWGHLPGSVATVNGKAISSEEFQSRLNQTMQRFEELNGQEIPEQFRQTLVQQTLQGVITSEIIAQQ